MLPFTTEEFLAVFARYNTAVWPLQALFLAAALVSLALVLRPRASSARVILVLLAGLWLWMGVVYHWIYFRRINPAAGVFAFLFVLQGLLFLRAAFRDSTVRFRFGREPSDFAAAALVGYALVIYPALGWLLGHRYPESPTFGLPCPTTIFTLGILLLARPLPRPLLAIPLLWSAIGTTAALRLGMREDAGLLLAALVTLAVVWTERRRLARRSHRPESALSFLVR